MKIDCKLLNEKLGELPGELWSLTGHLIDLCYQLSSNKTSSGQPSCLLKEKRVSYGTCLDTQMTEETFCLYVCFC